MRPFYLNPDSLGVRLNALEPVKSFTFSECIARPLNVPDVQIDFNAAFNTEQTSGDFEFITDSCRADMEMDLPAVNIRFRDWCDDPKGLCSELGIFTAAIESDGILLIDRAVASSTFDDAGQVAENTLHRNRMFWSSTGNPEPLIADCLIYTLLPPMGGVSRIEITAYQDVSDQGMPIYAPQFLRISIGFGPNISHMHYVGDVIPVQNSTETIVIELGNLVIGTYLRVDLYGRHQTHSSNDLFYTCISLVQCFGAPILHHHLASEFPHTFKSLSKLGQTFNATSHSACQPNQIISKDMEPKTIFRLLIEMRARLKDLLRKKDWIRFFCSLETFPSWTGLRSVRNLNWLLSLSEDEKDNPDIIYELFSRIISSGILMSSFELKLCIQLYASEIPRSFGMKDDILLAINELLIEGMAELGDFTLEMEKKSTGLNEIVVLCYDKANAFDKLVKYSFLFEEEIYPIIVVISSHAWDQTTRFLKIVKESWEKNRSEKLDWKLIEFLEYLNGYDPVCRQHIAIVFDEGQETQLLTLREFDAWITTIPSIIN
ncbi:hypothetical protein HK098_008370 [Nowakowskiella sp. JEL0407]|nr:hypothetical protein HK098_008370 [Nowakowskiella sp. JEL0407]